MRWPWTKSKPEAKAEKVYVLDEHQIELRQLWDKYKDSDKNESENCYRFWHYVRAHYGTELNGERWRVRFDGLKAYFEEVK